MKLKIVTTYFQSTIIILILFLAIKISLNILRTQIKVTFTLKMVVTINAYHLGINLFLRSFIGSAKEI